VISRSNSILREVDENFKKAFHDGGAYSGAHADLYEKAWDAAERETFQEKVGPAASYVMSGRSKLPGMRYVVPFVRTPWNIVKQALQHTPLGLLDTYGKVRSGEIQPQQLSGELAKPLVGTAIMGIIAELASAGSLTGAGPEDPRERKLWRETHQPFSLRLGDQWVSYARFEPFATIFGLAQAMTEAADAESFEEAALKAKGIVMENVADKTFFKGLTDIVEAVNDPKRYLAYYAKKQAGSLVPNLVAKGAQAIDPIRREPQNITEYVMARIPGLSKELKPRREATGAILESDMSGLERFLSPVYRQKIEPHPVAEALLASKVESVYAPTVPRRASIPGGKGLQIELTRFERERFEDANARATKKLERMVERPDFRGLPAWRRQRVIRGVYADEKERVYEWLHRQRDFRGRAVAYLRKRRPTLVYRAQG
jgi:hypothetical protein